VLSINTLCPAHNSKKSNYTPLLRNSPAKIEPGVERNIFFLCAVDEIRFKSARLECLEVLPGSELVEIKLDQYNSKMTSLEKRLDGVNWGVQPGKERDGWFGHGAEYAFVAKTIQRQAIRGLRLALNSGIPVRFNVYCIAAEEFARHEEHGFEAGVAAQLRWVRHHWERVRDKVAFYRVEPHCDEICDNSFDWGSHAVKAPWIESGAFDFYTKTETRSYGRQMNSLLKRGDLVYGLAYVRDKYGRDVNQVRREKRVLESNTIDKYNGHLHDATMALNRAVLLSNRDENMDDGAKLELAGRIVFPDAKQVELPEPKECPHWTFYVEAMGARAKYQPREAMRQVLDNPAKYDDKFRVQLSTFDCYAGLMAKRGCKLGLSMAAEHRIPVHFVLDELDLDAIAGKAAERGRSFTASELRFVRRNWYRMNTVVTFWLEGRMVAAPWETGGRFDDLYKPSTQRGRSLPA
jgi:hypothetical protein